ncbi:unnamed protein product [Oikopleura dioica]|uniref:Serine/threonine-protein kinase RIO1 n=1 Tax=Oikopleura dioica TaxID=34765 RepID=E4XQ51_OIKDI|nr:unnamed protein product [Oikopleura dioica]
MIVRDQHERKQQSEQEIRRKDKSQRATTEQVLDPRTRLILQKMLQRQLLHSIHGCISTGKEANVYHALTESGAHRAIKIYKTSILVFKDREKYMRGEFRWQRYCKGNPRKMVATWAEKEMRNLGRLQSAGIPSPVPLELRAHVLLMEFIGDNGVAALRLKDAASHIKASKWIALYLEVVKHIRTMYQTCKLVHGDLSEFNILYHKGVCYIIDVSQSVEHDHPFALDFLRFDCRNVNAFFKKQGVSVPSVREIFEFVVDMSVDLSNIDDYIDRIMTRAMNRDVSDLKEMEEEDKIFIEMPIPRTLSEIGFLQAEKDIKAGKDGGGSALYAIVSGLKKDMSGAAQQPNILAESTDEEADNNNENNKEEENDDDDEIIKAEDTWVHPKDRAKMTKEEMKEHKAKVKEAQREKRKHKMPKHVKKRKEKATKVKK